MERIRRGIQQDPWCDGTDEQLRDRRLSKKSCLIWLSESQTHTAGPGVDALLFFFFLWTTEWVFINKLNTQTLPHPLLPQGVYKEEIRPLIAFQLRPRTWLSTLTQSAQTHTHTRCKGQINETFWRGSTVLTWIRVRDEKQGERDAAKEVQQVLIVKSAAHQRFF